MNSVSSEIALGWVGPNAVDMSKYMTEEREEIVPSATTTDQLLTITALQEGIFSFIAG